MVGEDSGHIAMEYVAGGDLSQHCRREYLLPVPDVLQIGFKCCGALDYAAKEGIVHRDIKPANIMLVGATEVKIADFGAAVLKKPGRADGGARLALLHVARAHRRPQGPHLP